MLSNIYPKISLGNFTKPLLKDRKSLGVTTVKWWNRSFLLSSSPKNSDFDNYTQMRVPFWDPRVQWRSYTIPLGGGEHKTKTEIGHIEKGKRKIFTSPVSPHPQGGTA